MDREAVRAWKAGHEAANRAVLDEIRARTPAERFAAYCAFMKRLAPLGLPKERPDDLEYHLIWQRIRERWFERFGDPR